MSLKFFKCKCEFKCQLCCAVIFGFALILGIAFNDMYSLNQSFSITLQKNAASFAAIFSAIVTGISVIVTYEALITQPKKKETDEQKAKASATYIFLEQTRRELLVFKKYQIQPRIIDATNIAKLIVDGKELEKGNHEIDLDVIKKAKKKLFSILDCSIIYDKMFEADIKGFLNDTPNEIYTERSNLINHLPEKIEFTFSFNPGILTCIVNAISQNKYLNELINQWSKDVEEKKQIQTQKTMTHQQKLNFICAYLERSQHFYETVDNNLILIKVSMDLLKEYADHHYADHSQSFEIYGKTNIEGMMPNDPDFEKLYYDHYQKMKPS